METAIFVALIAGVFALAGHVLVQREMNRRSREEFRIARLEKMIKDLKSAVLKPPKDDGGEGTPATLFAFADAYFAQIDAIFYQHRSHFHGDEAKTLEREIEECRRLKLIALTYIHGRESELPAEMKQPGTVDDQRTAFAKSVASLSGRFDKARLRAVGMLQDRINRELKL